MFHQNFRVRKVVPTVLFLLGLLACFSGNGKETKNVGNSQIPNEKRQDFCPVLLKVEANYNQFQPEDTLWLTCWWQNVGPKPSEKPLSGFLELSFGHQRITELSPKYHREYWEPYPATNQWESGEIWKTSIRCKMNVGWGGSYDLMVGLCDENHVPVDIIGTNGKTTKQVNVGQVDVAWGWGTPTIERMRKPWVINLNKIQEFAKKDPAQKSGVVQIGSNPDIKLLKDIPIIVGIGNAENDQSSVSLYPTFILRDYSADQLIFSTEKEIETSYQLSVQTPDSVVYQGKITKQKVQLATFNVTFKSTNGQLQISMNDIREKEGYEFLEMEIPSLVSMSDNDSKMLSFWGGGKLIPLQNATPEGYTFKYDTRNAAALINSEKQLVLESECLDDKMILAVHENEERKIANIGMILVNRVQGHEKMRSIPVESNHRITVELLDVRWGNPGWQSVAKYLRRNLKGVNHDQYRSCLFYKTLATSGPEPPAGRVKEDSPIGIKRLTSVITFKEIFEQAKQLSNMLDGMKQVLYIGGFQEGGFDNSYPYVFNTDHRAGTVEELKRYISESSGFNATIGLHDNYDDMSPTPHFDSRIVALDSYGEAWKGWIWAGGMSHIIAPWKYAELGLMQDRVKKTVELYGVKNSYHLDVLSSELLRYDFDPQYPASAEKSYKGKLRIIGEFNKYGIDITSESLVHPFVGHLGFALWPRDERKSTLFKGDQYIPLIPFVYHGTIGYCGSARNDDEILWCMVRGSKCFPSEDRITDHDILSIYIEHIPVDMFYDKKMEHYEQNGSKIKVTYDENSYIEVDFEKKNYEIVCDGQLIGTNWTTLVPGFKPNSYLAYSRDGGQLDYPLPSLFRSAKKLRATTLSFDGEGGEIPCNINGSHLLINLQAGVPVRISNE